MRQIVLDTETTGLDPAQGHRIIEIGGVEVIDRRLTGNHFHHYLQPDREIEQGAIDVHGITNEFLLDKPRFDAIAGEFLNFVSGAELVIHNAPFDVGFINAEFKQLNQSPIEEACTVLDTLLIAREMYPGQRNNLDALCKRLGIDNSQRTLHGALLDAEILADVYLLMTGGQVDLTLSVGEHRGANSGNNSGNDDTNAAIEFQPTPVIKATDDELTAHAAWLEKLSGNNDSACLWSREN